MAGPAAPELSDAALARRFTATLLGVGAVHDGTPAPTELRLLRRLERAAHADDAAALLPRLPSVLPRLMSLVRRDDMSVRELAELLRGEPALLGEVMRIARSPHYLALQELTSLDEAIARLGQRGIQQVVSRAVLAPVYDASQGRLGCAAGTLLWEQALACAQACAGERAGQHDEFDAYLAGMAAPTGLIVALRLLGPHAAGAAPPSSAFFHDCLASLAAGVSAHIARQWRLPEAVAQAVESLAQAGPAGSAPPLATPPLAAALRRAHRASMLQLTAGAGNGHAPVKAAAA